MDLCAACVRSIRIIRLRAQNKASALRSHLCWLFIIFAWSRFQRHLAQRFCQRVSTPANLSTSDDPDLRFLSFVFKDARGQGGGSLRPHGALGENAHSGRFHRLGRSGPDPRNDQPDSRIRKNGDHQRKIAGRTDTVGRTAGRLLPDRRSPMGGLAGGRLSRAMTSGCEARILRSSNMMVCRKNVARPARTLHLRGLLAYGDGTSTKCGRHFFWTAAMRLEEGLGYAFRDVPEALAGGRRNERRHVEPFEAMVAVRDRPLADRSSDPA